MTNEGDKKGLRHWLFEKKFPGWLYVLILGVFSIILLLWFQSEVGKP